MKKYRIFLLASLILGGSFFLVLETKADEIGLKLNSNNLSDNSRKIFREHLVQNIVIKYQDDKTFFKMHEYMVEKCQELHMNLSAKLPAILIQDTLTRTQNLLQSTKSIVGNSLSTSSYDPARFEKSVQRFLWLKGLGFLVLGIGEEHKLAISYFYLPGNESLKQEFLQDLVLYTFPEIPDVPQNKVWLNDMTAVMGRLGHTIFSIKRFGVCDP